jgi:hypothetical protein
VTVQKLNHRARVPRLLALVVVALAYQQSPYFPAQI